MEAGTEGLCSAYTDLMYSNTKATVHITAAATGMWTGQPHIVGIISGSPAAQAALKRTRLRTRGCRAAVEGRHSIQ